MEAMSILERVERLENLAGITGPAICPDPTGEGSAWQGSPADPAPGSDAEHPPLGYVLVPNGSGEKIGYWISWSWRKGPREALDPSTPGERHVSHHHPMARPIPANEGDSQKEVAELRATVERLTAERDELRKDLDHWCKITSQVKDKIDEIQEALE